MLSSVRSFAPPTVRSTLRRFALERKRQWATETPSSTKLFVSTEAASSSDSSSSSISHVDDDSEDLLKTWREHPEIKKTLRFPTWVVPSTSCQKILKSPILREYLGTMDTVHPRIRLIRSYNDTHQLVLRNSDNMVLSEEARDLLQSLDSLEEGPIFEVDMTHEHWTAAYILHQLLPPKVHPPPTAFEQVGHVAHLNLRVHHLPYANMIGDVLITTHPSIETVVNKVGEVSGKHRTFDMELLAGRDETGVHVSESGILLSFDLKNVYWCSRLAGERDYLLQHYIKDNEVIADPFCGVGALCILAAKGKNCKILANDWNPHAVASLKQNAKQNNVESNFEKVICGDAYDFLVDIGLEGNQLPHHVVMNYPLESTRFLTTLRWWTPPKKKTDVAPTCHVYTFARESDDRSVEDVAIDDVADNLFPPGGATEPTTHRRKQLDKLGCNVDARVIRDVAPGKVVVCVSFIATRRLLRHMQGDFV